LLTKGSKDASGHESSLKEVGYFKSFIQVHNPKEDDDFAKLKNEKLSTIE
jgi:hypothetical protein